MRPSYYIKPFLALVFAAIAIVSIPKAHDNLVSLKDEQVDSLEKLFKEYSNVVIEDKLYLATNQPIYSPGESIWFGVFLKNSQLLKSTKSDIVHVDLLAPSGKVVQSLALIAREGHCGGDFSTSSSMPGGFYKIKAYTRWMQNVSDSAGYEKEILIQKVILPRLKMALTFDKSSYTKGEEVIARFSAITNDNLPLRNKPFTYELKSDGIKISEGTSTTGNDGLMYVRYVLPSRFKSRDMQMNVKIEYDGLTESINKAVPITSTEVSVEFFPEGGDMIASIPSRVAFRSMDEQMNPVHIEGIISDSKGKQICKIETFNKGMGSCYFTPGANESYTLHLTKPADVIKTWQLPQPLSNGFNLEVNQVNQELQLHLRSSGVYKAIIIGQVRGKVCYSTSSLLQPGDNKLNVSLANFPTGVAQFTVFDQRMTPRAERLVFVNRDRLMNISIQTEREQYQTRDKVKATIRTTDMDGNPIPAIISARVIHDQLLNYADDQSANLLSAMLLEHDLKEKIPSPNSYFDKSDPKSMATLDLLMLTSGWRRFSWKQILSKEVPVIRYSGERTMFTIQVIDGYTGQPIQDAQLKLKETGSVYKTDKQGKALFTNIDLYSPADFLVTADNYQDGSIVVSTYDVPYTVWLYDHINYKRTRGVIKNEALNEIPEAMMPLEDRNEQLNEVGQVVARKNNKPRAFDDSKPVMPDTEEKERPDREELIVDDFRFKGMIANDSILEKNKIKITTYYRSRQFPVKKYTSASATRSSFESTLYFNHAIQTDAGGRASFEFTTNDLISSFRIIAEGISDLGLPGRSEKLLYTQLPVEISSKIPGTLTSGDQFMLPVILKNNSSKNISGKLSLTFNREVLNGLFTDTLINLGPQTSQIIYRQFKALPVQMLDTILISYIGDTYTDETTVPVKVDSRGFPVQQSFSGRDLDRTFSLSIKDALPGTVKVSLTAYPGTISTLLQGISGLLRRPGGCFEQTSMSSYPNAMIMDYLKSSESGDMVTYAKAKELLRDGYEKLVTFETNQKGYEWFGSAPGHEALTAYGLMQFNEYKKLYSGVDETMINRTADWLLNRRDGQGGYKRDSKALDYFGRASDDVTNAYITYALSEAGYGDIQKEVDYAYQQALSKKDPYILALVANTLYNKKDFRRADEVLSKLLTIQDTDGALKGAQHSITYSTGKGLDIETTSLGLLAMLQSSKPDWTITEKAASYLVNSRSGYGDWGNTQATILALKALSKYSLFSRRTAESGTITVYLNDEAIGEASFRAGDQGAIEIKGLEKFVGEGKHQLKIKYKGCNVALPYTVNVTYNIALPPSSEACDVDLQTALSVNQCRVGDMVRMNIQVQNLRDTAKPSTTAIIGIPAGLSLQMNTLKALQEQRSIAYFEIWENNLVLYFRQLRADEKIQIPIDLKAEIPGNFEAAASNIFLYYTAENKHWESGEAIRISK